MLISGSTPSFSEFNPSDVPYQARVLDDMNYTFDYKLGIHEILLSGSVGSAKSILGAHLAIHDSLMYPNNRGVICRKAKPDLRDTIYTKICEHLEGTVLQDGTELKEGVHYWLRDTTCSIRFFNGSEIIARSWADGNYKKLGSIEVAWAFVEELTENNDKDEMAIKYLRMRVGRLPHIPRSWLMYATNPDAPSHFAYDYFDIGKRQQNLLANLPKTRHVYFSKTSDNKFLPATYTQQLRENLDAKLAARMIDGHWIEITTDVVYHAYSAHNYRDYDYEINPALPVALAFDFNIGFGKPMSMAVGQHVPKTDTWHWFGEVVIEGADTYEQIEEVAARGFLDIDTPAYHIFGDSTGDSRSANSKKSNYDIIIEFLNTFRNKSGRKVWFEKHYPRANPPVRERHNKANAYCKNALGKTRFYVYKNCPTVNKGMRLTSLKKGGEYIEDDSKPYQHVTTAVTYAVHKTWRYMQHRPEAKAVKIR